MIYFAQDKDDGLIKIGFASNVERRVRALQLTLLACIRGMRKTERLIHRKFAHLRVCGEWFLPEVELLDFIAKPELPSLNEQELRPTVDFNIRMETEMLAELRERAEGCGLSVASWARMILLRAANEAANQAN